MRCVLALLLLPTLAQARARAHDTAVSDPPVARRIAAEEANQGAASDGAHVYAIDNSRIGKYRITTGQRVATWSGDPARFPHLNSCTLAKGRLMCAASNYPAVPHASSVEWFDPRTLRHVRSAPLGAMPGSLTAIMWRKGAYWAVLANYDGRGGVPGRDHRHTRFVRMDRHLTITASWSFPDSVLERMAPRSCSGASWGRDGRLYVTGHDRREAYVLRLPVTGTTLIHENTVGIASAGQAIDWDPHHRGWLWSIDRDSRMLVANRMDGRETPSLSR